ncbi:uncharacterized protein LOC120475416 isoform X2 [Pimephales promelas]|uniref:uncharacterized protein LOC120475416 isoform X2 n=1 Tax=Pimephales promelas TaxID=90988 RepID=UPI001955DCEB|nr:uncharacterized protein LOC120475416 isoform X2 [Pimephales promelas]
MPWTRKCILPGCDRIENRSVSLFKFPKNDQIKKKWIHFVERHLDGELKITTNTRLCSDHFTPDSFINFHRRQLGFTDNPLLLASGAEPTISRLGPRPPAAPTPGAIIGSASPPKSGFHDKSIVDPDEDYTPETSTASSARGQIRGQGRSRGGRARGRATRVRGSGGRGAGQGALLGQEDLHRVLHPQAQTRACEQPLPIKRETEYQRDDAQKGTRDVGCQTDPCVWNITLDTRLSETTLANRGNTDSQAMVAMTTSQLPPLCSSTTLKRKAGSPDRPSKRPLLEFPGFQDMADPDDSSMSELVDPTSEQAPTKPPQDMVKYLVYEECLLELFKTCPTCSSVCKVIKFVKGTFLSVTQKCQSCSYSREWRSQPLLGSSPAGNLHLSAAVYYTGGSFMQTNQVLNALRVRTFSRTTHRNHVRNFILPSVLRKWRSHQSDLLERLKQRGTVSLGGDMRADGPGQCAKYGSYSMMDLRTNKIVDIQLVQSSEVGSSVRMEKEGLIRSLGFLEKSGVKVSSLVTDRHTRVQKFLQEQKPDVDHFYDSWRLCKALNKKIDAVSKEKHCNKVKMWKKSIRNHLYWSACGSSDGEETVAKWTSLLNHVQNVHVHEHPLFPKCLHPPSTGKNKWLKPGTKAIYKLEKVLMNERVLGDVKKLSPVHQSSALEAFHSEILRFAPKNVAFSYLGMLCRLYLAALHFNENSGRTQARTAAGELQFNIKIPKAKRGEHVSMMKTKYSTEYVTELTDILFNEVIQDPAPFVADLKAVAVPGLLCSQYE